MTTAITVVFRGHMIQVPRAQLIAAASVTEVSEAARAVLPSQEARRAVGMVTAADEREFLFALRHALRARVRSTTHRGRRSTGLR